MEKITKKKAVELLCENGCKFIGVNTRSHENVPLFDGNGLQRTKVFKTYNGFKRELSENDYSYMILKDYESEFKKVSITCWKEYNFILFEQCIIELLHEPVTVRYKTMVYQI